MTTLTDALDELISALPVTTGYRAATATWTDGVLTYTLTLTAIEDDD